jgi:small-conductance mechanosensitive channel
MLSSGHFLSVSPAITQAGLRDRFATAWDQLLQIGFDLVFVAILFLVARYTAKFIQRRIWKRVPIDEVTPATESLVNNSLALVVYAIAFTLTLAFLGASWSTLLTAFSVSTIAVVFGLASLLQSILGGAFLIFERGYEVGDRIKIRDNEGEVTEIGVRTTTMLTDDGATVIIPNSLHLSEPFRNLDRETQVSTVIRVVGINGELETVNQLIASVLGTDPPINGHVALTTEREAGFIDRLLTEASNHGLGSRKAKVELSPNTIHARIQLKVAQATSRETENEAIARLRTAFPDAIVSVRRSSLIDDERQDVE